MIRSGIPFGGLGPFGARTFTGSLVVLGVLAVSAASRAQTLLDTSGRVKLLDGAIPSDVRVTLGLDLDRDGELNSFETVRGTVADDGSYSVRYTPDPTEVDFEFIQFVSELAADYAARGFDAVLDDGPLPVVLRFEREGYGTVTKRFTTLSDVPSLDVVLAPLAPVHCAEGGCMAPDASVRISGFPGGTGIARAYARAYDPSDDNGRFPGLFSDRSDNLLISSGFTELDLRNESGGAISTLPAPVSVRFEASPTSWPSLRDLAEGSGRVEVPMYSFDDDLAEWVPEADGELEDADGAPLDETAFAKVLDGSRREPVFVSFRTRHFSMFNCDAPVRARACVKGRLVTGSGEAIGGVQVSVDGINYTGTAGAMFTGADGSFASDLMRSELSGEDVDGDGRTGRTFEARVRASAALGIFLGDPFDSPTTAGTVGAGCHPSSCDCLDLGDIAGDFEVPRACEVTVHVTFSGNHEAGSGGPLAPGDPVAGAMVTGELVGAPSLPLDDALCSDTPCNNGVGDLDGAATFIVPIVGDTPFIALRAMLTTADGGSIQSYSGSVRVEGCARGEGRLAGTIELEMDHSSLSDLGDFITSLGPFVPPPTPMGDGGATPAGPAGPGCGCSTAGKRSESSPWLLAVGIAAVARARRRRAGSGGRQAVI